MHSLLCSYKYINYNNIGMRDLRDVIIFMMPQGHRNEGECMCISQIPSVHVPTCMLHFYLLYIL